VRSGASRDRIRRVRTGPDEATEPASPPGPRLLRLVLGRGRSPRTQRTLLAILCAAAALLVVLPIVLWAYFRITHVISRNALVKGYITNVGGQIDGVVTSVEVETGQRVRAGQILARFEDHQLQAAVQRAESRLSKATRELAVERLAIEQESRRLSGLVTEASARTDAAKAQVDAARSQADDAEAKFALRKTLAENGMIAQEELRGAETTRRTTQALAATATADEAAARAAQRLAVVESEGLGVRRQHLHVLEAEVAALQADLSLAEADLKAALIRAPADGWVVRRISEAGSSVVVGQPVVALWIGNDVWVEAWIDEEDLASVAVGNQARVTVKSYPHRVYKGTVETVGVSTDYELPDAAVPQPRNTRMRASPVVCVRVRLDRSEGLFPGLSAVVGIKKKAST
jgi:membrane fusion protein, multidrug efflux system